GPGPLALDGALDGRDLAMFVRTLVREGCVGETIAAIEARIEHEDESDPAVRAALATIADDEARHAELAWRTVAWLLAEHEVRHVIEAELRQAVAGLGDSELARTTIDRIVEPCGRALLAS